MQVIHGAHSCQSCAKQGLLGFISTCPSHTLFPFFPHLSLKLSRENFVHDSVVFGETLL